MSSTILAFPATFCAHSSDLISSTFFCSYFCFLAFSNFPFLPSIWWSSTHPVPQVTNSKCTDGQMLLFFMLPTSEHCIYTVAFWPWGVLPIHFWPFSCSWVLFHERSASRYPVHLTSRGHCLWQVLLGALKSQWGYKAMRLWSVYMYTQHIPL